MGFTTGFRKRFESDAPIVPTHIRAANVYSPPRGMTRPPEVYSSYAHAWARLCLIANEIAGDPTPIANGRYIIKQLDYEWQAIIFFKMNVSLVK